MDDEWLTIGELAWLARRRASSIRYYEQIGLLPPPVRVSGQRRYRHDSVRLLATIEIAKQAGLSLDEIKRVLRHSPAGSEAGLANTGSADRGHQSADRAVSELRRVAAARIPEISAEIEQAMRRRDWLRAAAACECPTLTDCPLFPADSDPDPGTFTPLTACCGPSRAEI